ncbi:hypothetical protein Cgig2_003922 [Carnegiea gigantea]|uniref:Tyrosine decarboxylase n=1 Tax=Carnegiea gigantea TaxID=171969 RepID=A0A9Q1K9E5_9CARY|nr:hypothetical protein Cgig2_003922 [Carnegiea gigantea]
MASHGTTSTTAVDPVEQLVHVAEDYGMWVHVDAAYAGSACICPEFRHYLDGVERVDSLSLALHKSSRLWLVLTSHGVQNLQSHLRSDVGLVRTFEGLVRSDPHPRFEILVPVNFGLVCFGLRGSESKRTQALNKELLEQVNSTGWVYMTHAIAGGVYMLRFAVGSTLTQEHRVVAAWKASESCKQKPRVHPRLDPVLSEKNAIGSGASHYGKDHKWTCTDQEPLQSAKRKARHTSIPKMKLKETLTAEGIGNHQQERVSNSNSIGKEKDKGKIVVDVTDRSAAHEKGKLPITEKVDQDLIIKDTSPKKVA